MLEDFSPHLHIAFLVCTVTVLPSTLCNLLLLVTVSLIRSWYWFVLSGHFQTHTQNCEKWHSASCLSIRPHGTTRLPLDRFSWNLTLFFSLSQNLLNKYKFYYNLTRMTGISH